MSSSEALDAPEEPPSVTLEDALALAQGHHKAGNIVLAERTYRDILRAAPDHFQTLQFLGILLFQAGNFTEAQGHLKKAVAISANDRNCWNNYGAVLTQLQDYDGALEAYDQALKLDPQYLDALNNKTNVLWAQDDLKEAEKQARYALELSPDCIPALNNLGITLSKRSKFEESLDIWEKVSELAPEDSTIWANWGNSLREMGRFDPSEEKCRKAIELDHKNPEALNNLANALREQGKLEEALPLYRKATNERPNFYNAHHNLSVALFDHGLFEDAAGAARYAIAFKDDFAEAHSALSRALCEMGETDKAHTAAQRAIQINPEDVLGYLSLVDILIRIDHLDDAEAAMQEAIKLEPDSPRAYIKLSDVRERLGDKNKALAAVDKAIEMSPHMPIAHLRKANIYYLNGDLDQALKSIERTLELSPEWIPARQSKAEMLISVNQDEEALKIIRDILSEDKTLPGTYSTLVGLKTFESEDDEDFQNMRKLEDKAESYGIDAAATFYYNMALSYEKLKNYETAFTYLKRANDLKRKGLPFDEAKMISTHRALKLKYTRSALEEFASRSSCDSNVPVFIVGMPRSGTTLTEQILASHPDVYGAGELNDISQLLKDFTRGDIETPQEFGDEYVRRIKERDKEGKALRITDKMPAHYLQLGLIRRIFPNAKIIHCRRNPIDTCLSCYNQNFARGQYWSYDLETLADEYLRYLDTMEHWRTVLPDQFLDIDYEDTVSDLEGQARKLIDYIGLPWNEACLSPHKEKRAVLTASKGQVTQPVYKTSVEKWRRYEKQLQPLVRKLMPDLALPEKS